MAGFSTGIVWPSDVNMNPLRDSYQEEMESNILEFKPAAGPEKTRRLMSTSNDLLRFNLRLTAAEWASLKTFFRDTTADGTLYFLATNPLTGTTDTFKFIKPPPKIAGVKAVSYIVPIAIRKVADEILIDDGTGGTIDTGDGTLMRAM